MRQAGRYLLEYQEIKSRHSFLEMCTTPELALEVSLQPIRILDVDAAIVFADILLPLRSMGLEIDFNPGPKILKPLRYRSDIDQLKYQDPAQALDYVMRTLEMLQQELRLKYSAQGEKAVIGFAGAPWTMACYAIDQGPWKHFHGTQIFAYKNESAMHALLEKLTETTIDYLTAQLESGADAVQLFDSWAGNLSVEDYCRFALPYTQQIFAALKKTKKPSILYVNGSSHLLEPMIESGADCISVDWRTPIGTAQKRFEGGVVQGNFDPTHLFGAKDEVVARTKAMLSTVHDTSRYIANLGHGVLQQTPRENVIAFVDTIKKGWKQR